MYNSIIQAQCVSMEKLEHLFIDLEYTKSTNKSTTLYRSRSFNQKNKKYLQFDEIKEALREVNKNDLKYIYFVGKDPLSHTDFNQILRLCLNYAPVTIYTDGNCINDKKARFLKRVEDEGTNEIIFKIYINHFDEKTNDERTSRGSFRKAMHAISSLNKYGFNPILAILKRESDENPIQGFKELGAKFGFETEDINFCIIPESITEEGSECIPAGNSGTESLNLDCKCSRMLTKNGVYNCPLLANDYRGRCGGSLKDFSNRAYLETPYCAKCVENGHNIYVNQWE